MGGGGGGWVEGVTLSNGLPGWLRGKKEYLFQDFTS